MSAVLRKLRSDLPQLATIRRCFTTDGDAIAAFVVANPGAFPTILAQTEQTSLRSQIKTMRAEHAMYADFTQRNIALFERFTPKP